MQVRYKPLRNSFYSDKRNRFVLSMNVTALFFTKIADIFSNYISFPYKMSEEPSRSVRRTDKTKRERSNLQHICCNSTFLRFKKLLQSFL